jgi:hypothetical protein
MPTFLNTLSLTILCYIISSEASKSPLARLSLGFDFGTSGVRCCLLESKNIIWDESVRWDEVRPTNKYTSNWSSALFQLLQNLPNRYFEYLHRICISGTSSSMSLLDIRTGQLTRPVKMWLSFFHESLVNISFKRMLIFNKVWPQCASSWWGMR